MGQGEGLNQFVAEEGNVKDDSIVGFLEGAERSDSDAALAADES